MTWIRRQTESGLTMSASQTAPTRGNAKPLIIWAKVMFVLAGLLLVWALATLVVAHSNYNPDATSFPFSTTIIAVIILYVPPMAIALLLGLVFRWRAKRYQ